MEKKITESTNQTTGFPKSVVYKDFDKFYKCEITDDEDWSPSNPEEKKANDSFKMSNVRRIRKEGYQ